MTADDRRSGGGERGTGGGGRLGEDAAAPDLRAHKRLLRAGIRDRRKAMLGREYDPSAGLTARLIEVTLARHASSVSCYLPLPTEPDTGGYLAWTRGNDIRVLLPVADEDGVLDWAELDDEPHTRGRFGIAEPAGPRLGPKVITGVDLLFVPAAAVDRRGMRLGWGRGYVDRMLTRRHPRAYAVVFDDEILDELPAEPHDHAVDGVITEKKIVEFS